MRPLWIVERENTVVVKGNARSILEAGAFKPIYVGTVRGWLLDRDRLPDLLAHLDARGVPFVLTPHNESRDDEGPHQAHDRTRREPRRAADPQPGLWDGGDAA